MNTAQQLTVRAVEDTLHRVSGLGVDGYTLRAPIIVSCRREENEYVARVLAPSGIDLFGGGLTAEAAREDLAELLCESMDSLARSRSTLGPALLRELGVLELLISKTAVSEHSAPLVRTVSFATNTGFGGWSSATQILGGLAAAFVTERAAVCSA